MSNVFAAGPSFALTLNSSKTLPLAIVNKSGQPLSWQAVWAADSGGQNWLSLDRNAGNLTISEVQTIYVTANSAQVVGVVPGDFSGRLTITPKVGGIAQVAEVITIELHVSPGVYSDNGPKAPTVDHSRFDFNTQLGIMGPSQLKVTSNPDETNNVNWTMTSKVNWLSVNPNNGSFLLIGGAAPPPVNFNVAVQNAPAVRGTYTTDLVLTLTFSNPALASREPTSVLVPISVLV